MSLTLEDLKGELRENHQRIEEVLSGMDNYIVMLEKRIQTLEGQLAAIVAAFSDDAELEGGPDPRILLGRS